MDDAFKTRDWKFLDSEEMQVDKVAMEISRLLSDARMELTRDVYQFTRNDPGGIVILVTPDSLEVRLPTVEWTPGYAGPVASSRLQKRLSTKVRTPSRRKLTELIEFAIQTRQNETQNCVHCGKPTPPEHAHEVDGDWVCHCCSEHHRGIVH